MEIEVDGVTPQLPAYFREEPTAVDVRFRLSGLPAGFQPNPASIAEWLSNAPEPGCLWIVVDVYGDGLDVFRTRADAVAHRDAVRANGVQARIYPLSRSLLLPNL